MGAILPRKEFGQRVGTISVPILPFRTALFSYMKDSSPQGRFSNWDIDYSRNNDSYTVVFTSEHMAFSDNVPLGILSRRTCHVNPIFGISDDLLENIAVASVDVDKCDVCDTRKARNLYILWNKEENKLSYVAANCLKDFFGGNATGENIAKKVMMYVESSPADVFYRVKDAYAQAVKIDSTRALAAALFLVQKSGKGYISKRQQEYGSTASEMEHILVYEDNQEELNAVNDMLIEAAVLKQCILEEVQPSDNEFVEHLRDILSEDKVTKYSFGVIAAAPTFYERFTHNQKFAKSGKPIPGEGYRKGFLGEVGSKIVVENAYIEEIKKLHFGGFLVSFRNDTNNKIVWFTSNTSNLPELNTNCTVAGTVKKHDMYKQIDSTVLSRCKVSPTRQ